LTEFDPSEFQQLLLEWFDKEFRDLPWRQTRDPYLIWISEIMLQQTQVVTVIPYFQRFITRFPTIHDLAAADVSQVLKSWEGLGYYARARNLHQAARVIVREHAGQFPSTFAEVKGLPGIGNYTAAAILSIVWGIAIPAIDGNVIRILSRLFAIEEDYKSKEALELYRQKAEQLLNEQRPGDHNQAMMELGAVLCSPRKPKCSICPVVKFCQANLRGNPAAFPVKNIKKIRPHHPIAVGIVWKNGTVLIDRRPEKGLLGGLWEFPGGKVQPNESIEQAVVREIKEELDIEVRVISHFMTLDHAYTHFSITLYVYLCEFVSGTPRAVHCTEWRWVLPEALPCYAFPRANGRIVEKLLQENFSTSSAMHPSIRPPRLNEDKQI